METTTKRPTELDLIELIDQAKVVLKDFEETLGWKEEAADEKQLVQCHVNENHYLPQVHMKAHLMKCKWRKFGYSNEEVNAILDDEASSCTCSTNKTISTDDIVAQIAPGTFPLRTHEMHVSILTREERLRIYDEVVTQFNLNQQKLDDPFLYQDLDDKSKPASTDANQKSNIELIKEIRDHKRRRQSYRAKNVHVTKRSHTEVLREILAIHMEDLRKRWNPISRSPSVDNASQHKSLQDGAHEHRTLMDHRGGRYETRPRRDPDGKHRETLDPDEKYHEFRDRSYGNHRYRSSRERTRDRDQVHDKSEKRFKYSKISERHAAISSTKDVSVSSSVSSLTRKSADPYRKEKMERSYDADRDYSRHERKHKKHSRKRKRDNDHDDRHKKKKHKKYSPD